RRQKIEAGRMNTLIGRQRQVGAVGQAKDVQFHVRHFSVAASVAAMRATSMSATFCFAAFGHDSTPSRVMRWTLLRSPPMMPVEGETSLATIQSQPLRASLARAFL